VANERSTPKTEYIRAVMTKAAVQTFAEKGYRGSTVEEIAKRCGYSAAAIYTYFEGKDDLLQEALTSVTRGVREMLDDPIPDAVGFEIRLNWILARVAKYATENRSLFVIFLSQRADFDGSLRARLGEIAHSDHEFFTAKFTSIMKLGLAEGVLQPWPADEHAVALLGLFKAYFLRWMAADEPYDLGDHQERIVDIFLHGSASRVV
jgi:AcrR family transcriptional regulator